MRAGPECKECLWRLMRQVMELSTSDPQVKSRIEEEISRILEGFTPDCVPPDLSNEFHRASWSISKNLDPFRYRKREELEKAKRAFSKIEHGDDLRSCVELAAQGNAIDFFVDPETLDRELAVTPKFAVDDIPDLERKLEGAEEVLFLADNAGEVYFDLPLLEHLGRKVKTGYVVKESAVQNDLSIRDVERAGVDIPVEVLTSPPTVGFYPELVSDELKSRFSDADVVIAKGMGHYETLTELPQEGRFFYVFRAKCKPVARSLNINPGEYVAVLR